MIGVKVHSAALPMFEILVRLIRATWPKFDRLKFQTVYWDALRLVRQLVDSPGSLPNVLEQSDNAIDFLNNLSPNIDRLVKVCLEVLGQFDSENEAAYGPMAMPSPIQQKLEAALTPFTATTPIKLS